MSAFSRLPLRQWLPLSLLLAFAVLLGSLSWLHLADIRKHALEDAHKYLAMQVLLLQQHTEEELRQARGDGVQDELALVSAQPEVIACALVDANGLILAGSRLEWLHGDSHQLQDFDATAFAKARDSNQKVWRWSNDNRTLAVYQPVSLASRGQLRPTTGVLFISTDTGRHLESAQAYVLWRFLIVLGVSLSVLLLLMWLLRARLLRPLDQLGQALHVFGAGQHDKRLPVFSDPELAALAHTFNRMADAQQSLMQEVTQGRQNLAATLDSIGDAVIVTDAAGHITRMNGVSEGLTGWTFAEARGRPVEEVLELLDAGTRASLPSQLHEAMTSGKATARDLPTVLVRRDGSERHISDSVSPIRDRDGRSIGLILVCRDVSEAFHLREELREKETIYRLMAEQTSSFDYWVDPQGRYRYISPSCERITGYAVADFMHNEALLESITCQEDRAMVHAHSEASRHGGLPLHAMEFRILTKQGELRWLHHVCQDVFSEDGVWLGRRASNVDITARKEAEASLARHATDLEGLVAERTEQLQRSNEALERASRAKDEFLATMSHELRTPLSAILGVSELLRDQAAGPLNPKQVRHIRQIIDSGRHLLELIDDVLDVAKIVDGRLAMNIGRVDVAKTVEASLAMVREAARAKDLRLSVAEDGRVTYLHGDARRIRQALVNLLSNAVKFTPEGGRIGLEVLGNDDRKEARLTVWDTGIGIGPADQATLFQPFVQVDSQLSRQYSGTGLGLVLVKHMAELHQGRVELQSEPGKGSRFTVVLPWDPDEVWDETSQTAGEPIAAAVSEGGAVRRHVLLVDDNEVNLEMARELLERNGHSVVTASNGEEALAALRLDPLPDMVLLDIQMPVMDGPATLARIRADERTAGLRVVALTALAMSGDRDRLLEMGFDDYLAKPFQAATLHRMVLGGDATKNTALPGG